MPATGASGRQPKLPRANLKDIKKLIDMMRKAELCQLQVEQEGLKISLKRDAASQGAAVGAPMLSPSSPAAGITAAPASVPAMDSKPEEKEGLCIHSPMVGTFYRASSPDVPPYVELGSKVEPGQTVCIIEAMKLMNEIKAECSGTVAKILVDNVQPVEFGQPLFLLKP